MHIKCGVLFMYLMTRKSIHSETCRESETMAAVANLFVRTKGLPYHKSELHKTGTFLMHIYVYRPIVAF